MEDTHHAVEGEGPVERRLHRPARYNTLADGIFAIAMTLLALEIQVPDDVGDAAFGAQMGTFFGSLGVFVVAFFITAQYWVGHHRVMSYVHTLDQRALATGIMALLGISALPVATRLVVGLGGHWQSVVTASGMLGVTSLLTVRFYARVLRPELAEIAPPERTRIIVAPLVNVVVYLLTIVAALVLLNIGQTPAWAFVLWWLLGLNQPISRLVVRMQRSSAVDHP